tara:strand:- start:540 stop:749 length:210 start_codon:yes stop_codon:yes gene_type:complete
MASDNDWYSDESDETFYKEKEDRMRYDMLRLNEEIIETWNIIKEKTIQVKKMEEKYTKMEDVWNGVVDE